MFCGFGAVLLLYMIINADTVDRRNRLHEDLRGEVSRLEKAIIDGVKGLAVLQNSMQETQAEHITTQGKLKRVVDIIKEKQVELAQLRKETLSRTEHINALKADLKSLDADTKRLDGGAQSIDEHGDKLRAFVGQGDRQYLTGLKMGGKRVLILVDASASMLGDSIVNIIRRRNLPDSQKVKAEKWRNAVASADWLITQIPITSQFQMYTFNEEAHPVISESEGRWLDASDPSALNKAIENLRAIIPEKGTSLHNAFTPLHNLQPPPDNVFLLTDGLPTQGESKPWKSKVSGKERLRHFQSAVKKVPRGIPVNIILYPMEGDPFAASAYWKLAVSTRGAFVSPSRDWP
jgi:hypothetical protein